MFERFTDTARRVIVTAQHEARAMRDGHIDGHHLLLALASESDGGACGILAESGVTETAVRETIRSEAATGEAEALDAIGISLEAVRRKVESTFGAGALDRPPASTGHIPFTGELKKALELSLREALQHGSRSITTTHLLLGIIRSGGRPVDLLERLDADPAEIRARADRERPGDQP